jgi:hypothetical protein
MGRRFLEVSLFGKTGMSCAEDCTLRNEKKKRDKESRREGEKSKVESRINS